jgi:hypothetical protein
LGGEVAAARDEQPLAHRLRHPRVDPVGDHVVEFAEIVREGA